MANDIVEKENKPVRLRDSKSAKDKTRKALHQMLSGDDEYVNMGDHILIEETIEQNLDSDVKKETKLTSIKNIMRLVYLDVQGYGAGAISEAMALSEHDVQLIRRSESFKLAKDAVMAEILALSRRMIEVSSIKAVKTLTECMGSKNDKVRLSAAVEVLNRTGLTATQKIELTTTNNSLAHYTDDELAEMLRGSQFIPGTAEVITDGNT